MKKHSFETIVVFMFLLILFSLFPSISFGYEVNLYESEPNNSKATSTQLPYNWTTIRGNTSSLTDTDWYEISVDQPCSLTIEFTHQPDNYVYNLFVVTVYNSADDLLSQTYIYAPDLVTTIDVGLGEDGTYFVTVESACETNTGRCEYHHSDEYQLTVKIFETNTYLMETEPNSTTDTADNFANGGILTGQISTTTDADYYRINTSGAADVIVQFYHVGDDYQYNLFYVEIFDSSNTLLNATDIYAPDDITNFGFAATSAGDYYIKVTGCQSGGQCEIHRTDQYTIKALISPVNISDSCLPESDEEVYQAGRQSCIDDPESCGLRSAKPIFAGELSKNIQSYLVLTENSVPFYLSPGSYVQTFGSNGTNTVNVEEYARLQCKNFVGENEVNIEEASSQFTVYRSGATVYLNSTSGTRVEVAATETPRTLRFADGSVVLEIVSGNVMLGGQLVNETENLVDSPTDGSDTSESVF